RQPDHAAERNIFRQRIVYLGHVLEPGPIFADQLRVHVHNDVVVCGVDDTKTLLRRQDPEDLPDVAEIDHAAFAARGDVGGEYLDGRVAGLDRFADLAGQVDRQRAFHHDVLRVVAGAMSFPVLLTLFDRVPHVGAQRGAGEVDHRRGAAMHGGFADDIGWLGEAGAAVG